MMDPEYELPFFLKAVPWNVCGARIRKGKAHIAKWHIFKENALDAGAVFPCVKKDALVLMRINPYLTLLHVRYVENVRMSAWNMRFR